MASSSCLNRQSSKSDVISFLIDHDLSDVVEVFEANEVDGEDFFDLNLRDIYEMIPQLKARKRFLAAWSNVTKKTFDINGEMRPLSETPTQKSVASGSPQTPISKSQDDPKSVESNTPDTPNSRSLGSKLSPRTISLDSSRKKKSVTPNNMSGKWLDKFCLPSRWEPDVENGLKRQSLTPAEKNALVRQLCSSIMAQTETVGAYERNHIAILLIQKYPFLKGSFGLGHQMWAKKIEERILNVKRRARRNERQQSLEAGEVLPKLKPGRKRKNPSQDTVPDIPEGETEESLETQRKKMKEMSKQSPPDLQKINQLMDITYAKRRREVLEEDMRVWKLLQDYPAL